MTSQQRDNNAEYYDAFTTTTADFSFYQGFVDEETLVLELGCGSGRVTALLFDKAKDILGVDISESMLMKARQRPNVSAEIFIQGDITEIQLDRQFDLIIAPFRVLQALEDEQQVQGLLSVIKAHLRTDGTAILNVFNPKYSREEMKTLWLRGEVELERVQLADGDIVVMSDTRSQMDVDRQVLYPDLIYRKYREGVLIDEHINPICMRYYYPAEFVELIENHGFTIIGKWGGYTDEVYGEGGELILAFQ